MSRNSSHAVFLALTIAASSTASGGAPPESHGKPQTFELTLGRETAERLMRLSATAQEPGDNGWPLIIDAMNVLEELHADFDQDRLKRSWHRKELYIGGLFDELVKDDDRQIAVEALALFRKSRAGDVLNQAAKLPRFVVPLDASSEMGHQPWWSRLRLLAKAFGTSMQQAGVENDAALIISHAKCIAVLARAASYQPDAVSHLVGQACATMMLGEVRYCLSEAEFTELQLRELLQMVHRIDLAPFSLALEGERVRIHRVIEVVFEGSRGQDELQRTLKLLANAVGPNGLTLLLNADEEKPAEEPTKFAARADMHAEVDRLINAQLAIMSKPITEWRGAAEGLSREADLMAEGNPSARMAVYAGSGCLRSAAKTQATYVDGLRLMVAIHLYKARHAEFPLRLEFLEPDILTSVPVDVTNGRSFGYKPPSDKTSTFTLYMFGVDDEDNGGVLKENHEARAFDRGWVGEGYDFIINHPRPRY